MNKSKDDIIKELQSENLLLKDRLDSLEKDYSKRRSRRRIHLFSYFRVKKGDNLRREIEKTKTAIDEKVLDETQNKKRSYRNFLLFGILIGVAVSGSFFLYGETIASSHNIIVAVIIVLIGSLGVGLFLFFWFRQTLLFRFFKVTQASYEVIIENVFIAFLPLFSKNNMPPDEEVVTSINSLKEASKQIAAYMAYRRTWNVLLGFLIALTAGLAGYVGTVLLWRQNRLIKEQTYLTEASRRSSLIFMMSNIMDRVDEELNDEKIEDEPFHSSRVLSDLTIGRLAALSQSMKTINYLENDSIIISPISPERGQLLMALANSKLDTLTTYQKIFSACTFEYSDLKRANLDSLYLVSANLTGSNLSGAFLSWANLEEINLINAKMVNVTLNEPKLRGAKLNGAILDHSNLYEANLNYAHLTDASLFNSDLSGASMQHSLLNNTRLINSNLNNANLNNANLNNANFEGASLRGATLLGADLSYASFKGADLIDALLHDAIVHSIDWITSLKEYEVIGSNYIEQNYKIVEFPDDEYRVRIKSSIK